MNVCKVFQLWSIENGMKICDIFLMFVKPCEQSRSYVDTKISFAMHKFAGTYIAQVAKA